MGLLIAAVALGTQPSVALIPGASETTAFAQSGSALSGTSSGFSPRTIELGGSAQGPSRKPSYGTLDGHRRVVVRDLPAESASVLQDNEARLIPRRTPEIGIRATGGGTDEIPEVNAVDRTVETALQGAVPPTIATSFDGLDNTINAAVTGFLISPPDPQIAVGPNHVVEFVNIVGRITNKNGVAAVPDFALRDFFGLFPATVDTDPKVIYDAIAGRFFATYIDSDASDGHLYLAISQTNDPTGAWNTYFLTCPDCIPDYEGIGVTNDKFTISVNLFSISTGSLVGEQTLVVQKSDVIAGDAAPDLAVFPESIARFTVRPAQNLSPGNDQYLTTWNLLALNELTVIRVTGTPEAGNVSETTTTDLVTLVQVGPPVSDTAGAGDCIVLETNLGPPPCIHSGGFRMLEAVWRDNSLWSSASAACLPPGDAFVRSCAHLVEVETVGAPSVVQDIMFGAPGGYYSWPAIRTDASANLYVSMTHTNTSIFAEARVAGRLATDPLGTMTGSTLLRAGDVAHFSGRWGDYLGAAVDPTFPQCVWVVGEYAKSASGPDWGTYIGALSYTVDGCASSSPPTPTPTPTPTSPPDAGPEFVMEVKGVVGCTTAGVAPTAKGEVTCNLGAGDTFTVSVVATSMGTALGGASTGLQAVVEWSEGLTGPGEAPGKTNNILDCPAIAAVALNPWQGRNNTSGVGCGALLVPFTNAEVKGIRAEFIMTCPSSPSQELVSMVVGTGPSSPSDPNWDASTAPQNNTTLADVTLTPIVDDDGTEVLTLHCGSPPQGVDSDNDGCTDAQESGPDPALGGQRDPNYFWDFYDVYIGDPPARDRFVGISDILAIIARFGSVRGSMPTKQEALAEALAPPSNFTSYHANFDRGGADPTQNAWRLLPPDGSIVIGDVLLVITQFGHSCA